MKFISSDQQGITLIELLISLSLGLMLLLGLLTLYMGNKKTYLLAQELARIQEDGRIAMHIISRDLRMAGYSGCGRSNEINLHTKQFNIANSLIGWHAGKTSMGMVLPINTQQIKSGTDSFLVQSAEGSSVGVKSITKEKIIFTESHHFSVGDLLLIADCNKGEIFRFNTPLLSQDYSRNAQVSRWRKIVYYIARTNRKNNINQSIYALYRRDLNAALTVPNELIEGVEDMQILYAESADLEAPIKFVTADQINNWQAVRSIKINLLLVSKNTVNDNPQIYFFNNKKYQANDRRLYRTWQTIVALRQRNY